MKISSDDLSRQAYKKVKKMIVSKKMQPGQKILQEQLAHKLGISRTPLRTALQMLEAESLIVSLPRRGMMVREFSDKQIIETYDCRIALEGTAVKLFAERASQTKIDKLRQLLKPFENVSKIDSKTYQKADSEFHDTIILNCGNQFLYDLFHKGNLLVCIDMIGLVRAPQETLQEHIDIVCAIDKRDGVLAEKLIREHLNVSKKLILKTMKNEG